MFLYTTNHLGGKFLVISQVYSKFKLFAPLKRILSSMQGNFGIPLNFVLF